MATISVILDKRRSNKDGMFPVKIAVRSRESRAYISLSLYVPASAWIGDGLQRPVMTSYPSSRAMNDRIEKYNMELRQKMMSPDFEEETNGMSATEIKKILMKDKEPKRQPETFYSVAEGFIRECKSKKTEEGYRYTVQKLKLFSAGNLHFKSMNLAFLRNFEDFLERTGSGVNSRSIHFRNIRTLFNRAIDDRIISMDVYPFRKFKIRSEQRDKECLSIDRVRELMLLDLRTETLCMARDFWMLSFLLCGINPIDLFYLKKADGNNRVSFVRRKMQHGSHDVIRLEVQPEAARIVERYAADVDSPYLLVFEGKYTGYEVFVHFLSRKIREIADITGFRGLTMYWARYSWATIADGLDIAEKTISKALGHADRSMAGRKYIAYDWSKVDRANRKVIEALGI
jgi:integrase